MNIFKEKEDFIGIADLSFEENSFRSLFCLAKNIRTNLEDRGYLMDYYLSIFFKAIRNTSPFGAADDGFQAVYSYYSMCLDVLKHSEKENTNPLYEKTLAVSNANNSFDLYHLSLIRSNLLYALMVDEYISDAAKEYISHQRSIINGVFDEVQMRQLYDEISRLVGEPLMETLNLKLKQKFFMTPYIPLFVQGFAFDLAHRLTTRDIQTSRQIIQLVLDSISE